MVSTFQYHRLLHWDNQLSLKVIYFSIVELWSWSNGQYQISRISSSPDLGSIEDLDLEPDNFTFLLLLPPYCFVCFVFWSGLNYIKMILIDRKSLNIIWGNCSDCIINILIPTINAHSLLIMNYNDTLIVWKFQ